MSEERIGRHARAMETDVTADPRFLARLHDELAEELGLGARRSTVRLVGTATDEPVRSSRSASRGHGRLLLLAAAIVVAGTAAAAVGSRVAPAPDDRGDLLATIREADRMRVGVVTGYPQAQSPDGAWGGFDSDVAARLAEQLGVPAELVVSTGPDLQARPETWDITFPSLVTGPPRDRALGALTPVYHWPIEVLVAREDVAQTVGDIAGRRVCAVAGSAGAAWLAGATDLPSTTPAVRPPAGIAVVTAADDQGCLGLLTNGEVTALVTSTTGPADLVVRPAVRALDGPVLTLPMAPIVSTAGPDPSRLRAALDEAIVALREDGTLLDLSRRRFGADLVTPPTP